MDNTNNVSVLDAAIKRANAQATAYGSGMLQGNDAFQNSNNQRVPQDPERSRFQNGDRFTVPADENSKQWIALPLSQGGRNVTRLLSQVSRDGNTVIVDTFIGTFLKSGTSPDGTSFRSVTLFKDGTNFGDLTVTCASATDCWRLLMGKTFVVSNAREVSARARTKDGQPTQRQTWVYTFTEV